MIIKKSKNRLFLLILSAFLFIIIPSFSFAKDLPIGKWGGTDDKGAKILFIFDEENYVTNIIDNEVFGGKKYKRNNGQYYNCKYVIDKTKNPIWLDLVIYDMQGREVDRTECIMQFINNDKMRLRFNFNKQQKRHQTFDPNDKKSTIILDRIE
jgi:hypothetical protein